MDKLIELVMQQINCTKEEAQHYLSLILLDDKKIQNIIIQAIKKYKKEFESDL